jgi:lysine-N-methylase
LIQRVPHYYKAFHCIASDCRDNCCVGGWEIDIDEETAQYYLSMEGEFGDRLRNSITRTDEYCFRLKDGKCPFLDSKGLCEIYQVLGEDKMGVVCTQFPRYTEYYGAVKETGIGLACEEAARIICQDKEAFTFNEETISEEEVSDAEFDAPLAKQLFSVRSQIFEMLTDTKMSLEDKLILLLEVCHQLQEAVNVNDTAACDRIAQSSYTEWGKFTDTDTPKQQKDRQANVPQTAQSDSVDVDRQDGLERILYAYDALEVLNEDWNRQKEELFSVLHGEDFSAQAYRDSFARFKRSVQEREREYINLTAYFVFRYFMKAAYDHDVYGKAQLITANYLVLQEMDFLRWIQNGEKYGFKDRMELIHIFSREVEYSEENLEDLAEEFLFDDIFEKEQLCALLKG